MASRRYDLHVHSTASDGALAPREIVALAAERGLAGIALTDEGTVGGIEEARAMAGMLGIDLIPGVELVCATGAHGTVRLLGYFVEPGAPSMRALLASGVSPLNCAQAALAIHGAGGAVVLGFPGGSAQGDALDGLIAWAASIGVDGIEVDHPEHGDDTVRRCAELAERHGLVQTSGSDDRGTSADGPRLGCRTVTERAIERLRARAPGRPASRR